MTGAPAAGFTPGRAVLAAVAVAALASPGSGRSDSAAAAIRVAVPVVKTLDNGLRVAVFPDPRLPIVEMLLMLPAGSSAEPPGQEGVAQLTAQLLGQGTPSRDAAAFADELDRLGGKFAAGATRDYATVDGKFLARDFEVGIELMSEAVVSPLFGANEIERAKRGLRYMATGVAADPARLAEDQMWALVFRGHPYGRPIYGAGDSLSASTREQIRAFHGARYRPDQAILGIAGDVTPEHALAAAREWFGRWSGRAAPSPPAPPLPPARARIRVVDRPGATETLIELGLPVPGRGSPDEAALGLANAVFGGPFSSRLGRDAERRRLGRGARSFDTPLRDGGLFMFGASVPNDSVRGAAERLRAELRRFITDPPGETELEPVRRTLRGVFRLQFETLGGLLVQWCASALLGGSADALERSAERLDSLDAAAVAGAAKRWLDPQRLSIVAIGPADRIKARLAPLGPVEIVRAGAAAPRAAEVPAALSPPTEAQKARGRELVRLAIVAHGGLARLRGIKDSSIEADATYSVGGRQMKGELRQVRKDPYRMVSSTSFTGFTTDQTLNGNRAWSVTTPAKGAAQDMDSLGVAGLRTGFASDLPHLLLGAAEPGAVVASRGRRRIQSRLADAVEVRGRDGQHRMLYLDAVAHRLLAMDQQEEGGAGSGFSARRLYRDYRPVKGILWPHSEERLLNGERVMEITIKRVALDTGVEDALFERPDAPLPLPSR